MPSSQLPADWKDNCGLEMVTANDGSTEWVLPEDAAEFKREGAKMLPGKQPSATAPSSSAEQPPAAPQSDPAPRQSASEVEAVQVVAAFLEKCDLSPSQSQAYAEALVAMGYDTEKWLQALLSPTAEWPAVIKPGHKNDIIQALQAVGEKAAPPAHALAKGFPCFA